MTTTDFSLASSIEDINGSCPTIWMVMRVHSMIESTIATYPFIRQNSLLSAKYGTGIKRNRFVQL